MTRRRVFVVAAEYSASPRDLQPERRRRDFFGAPHQELRPGEASHLFFRYPNRSDDGRTRPDEWQKAFGIREPIGLQDWPKDCDDPAGKVAYFCYERNDARPLPFIWEKAAEISCDRDRTPEPEEVVIIGRRLPPKVAEFDFSSLPSLTSSRSDP